MAPRRSARSTKTKQATVPPATTTSTTTPPATSESRQPLAITTDQQTKSLAEIFNSSQHVTTTDLALNQLKKFYKSTSNFETLFRDKVRKLMQSQHTIYFKTSCDFLCKFLKHLSQLSDEIKSKNVDATDALENTDPSAKMVAKGTKRKEPPAKRGRPQKRGVKRKAAVHEDDDSEDELLGGLSTSRIEPPDPTDSETDDSLLNDTVLPRRKSGSLLPNRSQSTIITNHDRVIAACVDVALTYMQAENEEGRFNAVFFISKLISQVGSLDEELCAALKNTLPMRIRDKKPNIRVQAVFASRTFQDYKLIKDGFMHHFYWDPEPTVRKALLQVMEPKIFDYQFMIDSTQDTQDSIRKIAFQRLGKIDPSKLSREALHQVLHNGLIERERQVSYNFKTHTLNPWLAALYDGTNLYHLIDQFDVLNHQSDMLTLLESIYERDLDKIENNGATTRLHQVVEAFRERWLTANNTCLPQVEVIDEKLVTIWLSLIKFTKKNQAIIKQVKVREAGGPARNTNESLEKILDSLEIHEESVELYERLCPDLVNLLDFLKRFIGRSSQLLKNSDKDQTKLEFIYHELMGFILTYEIGDELERKTVQEVLGVILKDNLLTGKFSNFIPPIIKTLHKLVYSSSSNLMINYISELINNVRSHLEDLASTTAPHNERLPNIMHSAIKGPSRANKKVRIDTQPRVSYGSEFDPKDLLFKIASLKVELEELKDKLEVCIKEKDFDTAKKVNEDIETTKRNMELLVERRCSTMASDVSHMSILADGDSPGENKLSSTMIQGNLSMNESNSSADMSNCEDPKIFKKHPNDLIKCLQMYYGCLQNVKITEVPVTMRNHLSHLSYESLGDWFKKNVKIRSLMVACNGLTALIDKNFAQVPATFYLLIEACMDQAYEVRTAGFKGIVDMFCEHRDLAFATDKLEKFLRSSLREYGKYNEKSSKKNELEFANVLVEGTSKLFYHQRLSSPEVLAHLIIWWYHPGTPSKLKQHIGIFLPLFVNDMSARAKRSESEETQSWLKELLETGFVISIEYLHDYILGPGQNIMSDGDMMSLINFLTNLIPITYHNGIHGRLDDRIGELSENSHDLVLYLKRSKKNLSQQANDT